MQPIKALALSIIVCVQTAPAGAAPGETPAPGTNPAKTERSGTLVSSKLSPGTTAATTAPQSSIVSSGAVPVEESKHPANTGNEPSRSAAGSSVPRVLKGGLTHTLSPFKEDGSVETIKQGTSVSVTLSANLNSEVTQVGDQVCGMVTLDLKDKEKVLLPGQWHVRGKVTRVEKHRRGGLDGYVEIKFEKLVSPDGKVEVPFDATVSTKDSAPKAIAKHIAKDVGFTGVGAIGGAILSVQTTGIPLAVATHGISVGIGAAGGAALGAVAAARRQGKILSALPGDELKLKIDKEVVLPAFNPEALPSAAPPEVLEGADIFINKSKKSPDPYGDKASCLLTVNFRFTNNTEKGYCFGDFGVISDHNHSYLPFASSMNMKESTRRVGRGESQEGTITYHVGSSKHKYWLVLKDRAKDRILSRVPIN